MKKVLNFSLIFCPVLLFINLSIFAQSKRWQFVASNDNGSTSYLDTTNQKRSGNKRQTWVKDTYQDGSYKITLIGWQCRERKFRVLEAANYTPSGEYIDQEGNSAWVTIIPDSVSEKYHRAVCISVGQKITDAVTDASGSNLIAQIIARNANIRELPTVNSRIIQIVGKGTELLLVNAESRGWYQVIVPKTGVTGWLHGNTIKLIELAEKVESKTQRLQK